MAFYENNRLTCWLVTISHHKTTQGYRGPRLRFTNFPHLRTLAIKEPNPTRWPPIDTHFAHILGPLFS